MTALISIETLLLILLSMLVVALLRSHAEILRRLGPESSEEGGAAEDSGLPRPPERDEAVPAVDLQGETLQGEPIQVGIRPGGPPTLLAFLSSGCTTCEGLWSDLRSDPRRALPGGARLVIVVKGPDRESPSRLRKLAPTGVSLVMSSAAWEAYRAPSSPYFVYVDGASGRIYGEGSASAWRQVESLLADALYDIETGRGGTGPGGGHGLNPAAARARRAEVELGVAGIGPGHTSLYPAKRPERRGEAG